MLEPVPHHEEDNADGRVVRAAFENDGRTLPPRDAGRARREATNHFRWSRAKT